MNHGGNDKNATECPFSLSISRIEYSILNTQLHITQYSKFTCPSPLCLPRLLAYKITNASNCGDTAAACIPSKIIFKLNDGSPLVVVQCWDNDDAYWSAVRYDLEGNVLYTINDEETEGDNFNRPANEIEINSPENVKLENYPNPFNPVTKINYQLQITNYVSIKVYNSLGKEVAEVVNEEQSAAVIRLYLTEVKYAKTSFIFFLLAVNTLIPIIASYNTVDIKSLPSIIR